MSERLCLRCKTVPLTVLEPPVPGITFFECPSCYRHYALEPGKALTFRWLHPISLALYDVQWELAPTGRAVQIAEGFIRRRPREELEVMVSEIRLELEEPTQEVRDILGCRASEKECREFLRLFVERLEGFLGGKNG